MGVLISSHDCYSTCGKSKAECDQQLFEDGARLYSTVLTGTSAGRGGSQEAYNSAQRDSECDGDCER